MANILRNFRVTVSSDDRRFSYKLNPHTGAIDGDKKDQTVLKVLVETRNTNIFGYYQNNSSAKFKAEYDFSCGRLTLPIVFDPTVKSMTEKTATVCIYDGANISGVELGIIVWCGKLFLVHEERWRAGIRKGAVEGIVFEPLQKFIMLNAIEFQRKKNSIIGPLIPVSGQRPSTGGLHRGLVRVEQWSPVKTMGRGKDFVGNTVLCELKQLTKDFESPMSVGPGSIVRCDDFIPLGDGGRYNLRAVGMRPHKFESPVHIQKPGGEKLGDNPVLAALKKKLIS